MAAEEITGRTESGLQDLREEFQGTPVHQDGTPFNDAFCLARIGKQPEHYDGPQRHCTNRAKTLDNGEKAPNCRFHGGRSHAEHTEENLDPLAAMKHGYYAVERSMLQDLDSEEREAFKTIINKGEKEGITYEDDFFAYEDLVSLALNIVTDARIRQIINDDGVEKTVNKFDDGQLVDQEEEEHHLVGVSQKQRRLILKLKDQLALSRKHDDEMDAMEGTSNVDALIERMGEAVDDDEQEYDPDDWEDDG